MKTYRAMVVLCLLLAAVGMSMNPSSASEREDIFGQGTLTRVRIVVPPVVQVSDCGDTDPATFIRSGTRTGTDTFSGIITGTGTVDNRFINNTCVPALQHGEFRTIVSFSDVTVGERTGGAVLEFIGHFQVRATQVAGVDGVQVTTEAGELRFLCGSGALKGISGTGVYSATVIPSVAGLPARDLRAYAISVRFGDPNDATERSRDLCQDL